MKAAFALCVAQVVCATANRAGLGDVLVLAHAASDTSFDRRSMQQTKLQNQLATPLRMTGATMTGAQQQIWSYRNASTPAKPSRYVKGVSEDLHRTGRLR